MAMRYRRSFKVAPGVKVNLGKKSAGISIGGKTGGVSINSKTGVTTRTSIPGTGVSFTEKLGTHSKAHSSTPTGERPDFSVKDETTLNLFLDADALSSLNNDAFIEYGRMVTSRASNITIDDNGDYVNKVQAELALINSESERRKALNLNKRLFKYRWAYFSLSVMFTFLAVTFFYFESFFSGVIFLVIDILCVFLFIKGMLSE